MPGGQAQQHVVLHPGGRKNSLYMAVLRHCRTE
jgi:hypothetical protein